MGLSSPQQQLLQRRLLRGRETQRQRGEERGEARSPGSLLRGRRCSCYRRRGSRDPGQRAQQQHRRLPPAGRPAGPLSLSLPAALVFCPRSYCSTTIIKSNRIVSHVNADAISMVAYMSSSCIIISSFISGLVYLFILLKYRKHLELFHSFLCLICLACYCFPSQAFT